MAIAEEQDFYVGEASRLRVALSEEKLQQLANSAGAYDSETYIVQYLNEERRPYIIRIAGDKTVARRVFHEAILSEMSFMTIPFGFYAATAGVRNVSDLARVSYSKLCAVLNILEKSVRLPKDIYFEKPTNEEILNIQTAGLSKRLVHTHCLHVVIGISGGLDSTLALLVCVRTFDKLGLDRKGIVGVTMPGFGTTDRTHDNAASLMQTLNISQMEISISDAVTQHFKDIGHDAAVHDATYENSQARERTQILMEW